jgi:hypothetical protein
MQCNTSGWHHGSVASLQASTLMASEESVQIAHDYISVHAGGVGRYECLQVANGSECWLLCISAASWQECMHALACWVATAAIAASGLMSCCRQFCIKSSAGTGVCYAAGFSYCISAIASHLNTRCCQVKEYVPPAAEAVNAPPSELSLSQLKAEGQAKQAALEAWARTAYGEVGAFLM